MAQHILQHRSSHHLYPGSRFAPTLFHWLKRTTIFLLSAWHSSTSGMPTTEFSYWVSSSVHLLYRWFGIRRAKEEARLKILFLWEGISCIAPVQGRAWSTVTFLQGRRLTDDMENPWGEDEWIQEATPEPFWKKHHKPTFILNYPLYITDQAPCVYVQELPKTNRAAGEQAATAKMEVILIIITVVPF